jgi:hypothetical protein
LLHRIVTPKQGVDRALPIPSLDQCQEPHVPKIDAQQGNPGIGVCRPNHEPVAAKHDDRIDRAVRPGSQVLFENDFGSRPVKSAGDVDGQILCFSFASRGY